MPFNQQRIHSEQFPEVSLDKGMSAEMIKYFAKQQAQHREWVECPSKHRTETVADKLFKLKTRVFKAGSAVDGVFGDQKQTAWTTFCDSIREGHFDATRT